MTHYLEINQIVKAFATKVLYSNLSFTFRNGCYALTGPNGVGKTVLLEMLAGTLAADQGSICLSDIGLVGTFKYKQQLAYIPSKPDFFPFSTGHQFLSFIASVNQCRLDDDKINSLLHAYHLEPYLQTKFMDMSLGTQKKLFLSTLAMREKTLFVLDEPTNGLDIEACKHTADFLAAAAAHSIVILATHDQTLLKALNPHVIAITTTPITRFITHAERNTYAEAVLS